jgi:hypothetical protein
MCCEEHRDCEECHADEGAINTAAASVRTWAWAIQSLAEEAADVVGEDELDRREALLAAIEATSTAIGIVCERDIENVTREARRPESPALRPIPPGGAAS